MTRPLPAISVATLIVLGALAGSSTFSSAQGVDIGFVAAANPRIDGTPPNAESRILKLGMNIFQNEYISTSEIGSGQFIFLDQTTLTVSPGSEIVLDKYVFDAASGYGEVVLTLSKGVLRFIGGRITKSGEGVVNTPHATIGIRGGIVAITVGEIDCPPLRQDCTRTTAVLLAGKSMTVKGESKTIVVTKSGGMVSIQSDAPAGSGSESSDTETSEPAASEPAASEPATSEPTASEPVTSEPAIVELSEPEFVGVATAEDINLIFDSTDTGGDGGTTQTIEPVIVAAAASTSGLTEVGAETPGAVDQQPISTEGEEAPPAIQEDSTTDGGGSADERTDPATTEADQVADEIAEAIEELADDLGITEEEAIEVVVAILEASSGDSDVSEIEEEIPLIGEEISELAETLGITDAEATEVVVEVLEETPPSEGGDLSDIIDDISEIPSLEDILLLATPIIPPEWSPSVPITQVFTGGYAAGQGQSILASGILPDPYVVRSADGNGVIMGFDAVSNAVFAEFGPLDSFGSADIFDITLNFGSGLPSGPTPDDNVFAISAPEFETGVLTGQAQSISGFSGQDPDISGIQTAMQGTVSSAGLVGDNGIFPAGTDTTPEFLRWGWWAANYQFADDDPGDFASRSEIISGTWVSGVRTDIAALGTSGEARFDGLATAHVTEVGGAGPVSSVDGGRYLMTFDFGTRTGAATITGIAGTTFVSTITEAGAISGNHFGGALLDTSTFATVGSLDGSFFTGAGDPTAATGGAFDFTRQTSGGVTQTGAGIFAADKVTN